MSGVRLIWDGSLRVKVEVSTHFPIFRFRFEKIKSGRFQLFRGRRIASLNVYIHPQVVTLRVSKTLFGEVSGSIVGSVQIFFIELQ